MRLGAIDAAFRAAFSWTVVRLLGGNRRPPIPDWGARPYRVLFIRDDGLGDLVVSIEILRAIAESHQTITLDLLCSPQNAAIARTLPFVREVIVHERQSLAKAWPTWRLLRRRRYDVVIDGRLAIANVNKHTTFLMLATGAAWRIGLGGRTNDRVYNVPIRVDPIGHWVDALAALATPFGVSPKRDWHPRIPVSRSDRAWALQAWTGAATGRPRVLVNLYSASRDRAWPIERFAPVLARLRERLRDAAIVIPTLPAGDAASASLARPVHGATLAMDLKQLIAFTALADLVISPLTGVSHVAAAFGVPTLTLLRRDMEQWVPYRATGENVFSHDPRSLLALPAGRVVAALDKLIDTIGRERGWLPPG
jgi:heptosyltransferase I